MQTRRDRVQAYNFTVGRLGSAMMEADPDAVDQPMRRTRNGNYIGLAIAALVCVGFLIFGLIFPGGATSWQEEGTLVVDKNSGATYLYGGQELRPVANYASARLISGGKPQVSRVTAESLDGVHVGSEIGIPGAPDALPNVEKLADNVWRLCALPAAESTDSDGAPRSALTVGPLQSPGRPLRDRGVLVSGPEGERHLLWKGERLRLDADGGALQALGYGTAPTTGVPEEFLEAVPAGPDLAAPSVAGAGTQGPSIAGAPTRVGQVFAVAAPEGGDDQHYLLTGDGLEPLTQTEALLVLADSDITAEAYPGGDPGAVRIPAGEVNPNLSSGAGSQAEQRDAPAEPPRVVALDGQVPCLVSSGGGELSTAVFATGSVTAWEVPRANGIAAGCPTPDLIGIPTGAGGIASAQPIGGTANASSAYVVTDTPAKYRVSDEEALGSLGYQASDAAQIPTSLLRLLPTGPVLSPKKAAVPVADAENVVTGECPSGGGQGPQAAGASGDPGSADGFGETGAQGSGALGSPTG
ncbi:type VII secretion protein EccB [Streptomonospora wellingtoniae]|uniref:Type VII secretion protein EccB n=1 Tax=Streptomonospora wellingtoniae TaxID=3075544 RepID=A0ABU2L0B9_9ACTN|nr:type VII secretion protein EccB [Streptomonospora sp. DSM 45055]MDT0304703.1 type VII secretion protein EccB [Streptomonospora sp. DSM 45055]